LYDGFYSLIFPQHKIPNYQIVWHLHEPITVHYRSTCHPRMHCLFSLCLSYTSI